VGCTCSNFLQIGSILRATEFCAPHGRTGLSLLGAFRFSLLQRRLFVRLRTPGFGPRPCGGVGGTLWYQFTPHEDVLARGVHKLGPTRQNGGIAGKTEFAHPRGSRQRGNPIGRTQLGPSELATQYREVVAEQDDLELLELIRTEAQRREPQKTPEHEVTKRPEQRVAPPGGRNGRPTPPTKTGPTDVEPS
jgi:hypothetical protein